MRRLVFTLLAVLLTAQLAMASDCCPGGNCPLVEQQQAEVDTPPEWLCHVDGASGSLIAKTERAGLILSALHVVAGELPDQLKIDMPDGSRFTGRAVVFDRLHDLVLIEIAPPAASPCPLATRDPIVGDAIQVVGYGNGRYQTSHGRVTGYVDGHWIRLPAPYKLGFRETGPGDKLMVASALGTWGDSGCAILNSRGELCGVLSVGEPAPDGARAAGISGASTSKILRLCATPSIKWNIPTLQHTQPLVPVVPPVVPIGTVALPAAPPVPTRDGRLGISVRDDIRRQQKEIENLRRIKADGGITLPVTLPVEFGVPPGVSVQGNAELTGQLNYLHDQTFDLNQRVVRLEGALDTALEIIDGIDPAKIKTEVGEQLYGDVRTSIDQARAEMAQAAAALTQATGTIDPAARLAAKEAVNETLEDPSFWERFKNRASQGLIPGYQLPAVAEKLGVTWVWKLLSGVGLTTTIIAIAVAIAIFVLRRRVPVVRRVLEEGAERLTDVIPGKLDDRLLEFGRLILNGVDDRINRLETRFGIPTPPPRETTTKEGG